MTLFLKNERDHIVWNPVFTFLDQIGGRIDIPSVVEKFQVCTIMNIKNIYIYFAIQNLPSPFWFFFSFSCIP